MNITIKENNMKKLLNDCREGEKPEYYFVNKNSSSFVFSSKEDLTKHIQEEGRHFEINENPNISFGEVSDININGENPDYEVVPILNPEHNMKGTDDNYLPINPLRKRNEL